MPVRYEDILEEFTALSLSLEEAVRSESGATEDQVWSVYAGVEKLVAILKLRMDFERPGVFLELPRSKTPEVFLSAAVDKMRAATESLTKGDLVAGLEQMGEARSYLRGYLAEMHRARMREKRRAAAARRSSP